MFGEVLWMLAIPAIGIGIMFWLYHDKVTWKEALMQFLIPCVILTITYFAFYFARTTDTEYLNSYALKAYYEERWDEEVPCTHAKYRTETDSKGNTHEVFDGYEHAYDVDDHPPKWYVFDNCGCYHSISSSKFAELCKRWSNKSFKDMHRDYHSRDGDMYYSDYPGNVDLMEPLCWTQMYKNKVQNSKSVFSEIDVDKDDVKFYKLFDYNQAYSLHYEPIYGWADRAASDKLRKYNAIYGKPKQLHMNLLVFQDQPIEAALYQQSYWKGGNKNEFNVCVGIKGKEIQWCKVISWTEEDILKIETSQAVASMGDFDAEQIVDWMGKNVPLKWKRKEFADFEYLSVSIPFAGKITCFVLITVSTIGLCILTHRADIR